MPHLLRHGTSVYTVSSEGPAKTSRSGIRTGDARIIRSLRLRSNHCATVHIVKIITGVMTLHPLSAMLFINVNKQRLSCPAISNAFLMRDFHLFSSQLFIKIYNSLLLSLSLSLSLSLTHTHTHTQKQCLTF